MQKFSCVIVDDEPIAAKYLALFVDKIEDLNLVKTFSNPVEALDYLEKEQIDLVFLDIQMPRLSGIEIAKKISQKSLFIFTTAYTEYAVEGFDLEATDYLLKPISYDRFFKASKKAIDILKLKINASVVGKEDFKRVHKSFIVSTRSITAVSGNTVELGTLEIPIGGIYKEALMDFLKT